MSLPNSSSPSVPDPHSRRGDLLGALLFTVAAIGLYALTFQPALFDDGYQLTFLFTTSKDFLWYHVLYFPIAHTLQGLAPFGDHLTGLRWVSILGGSIGVGGSFLLCRRMSGNSLGAIAAAALLLFSPAVWFHSTTIEVHSLHFAAIAIAACLTVLAPWRTPVLATGLVALVLFVLPMTHMSVVLLAPGWLWLVQWSRSRVARPFHRSTLILGIGSVLLGSLLLSRLVIDALLERSGRVASGGFVAFVKMWIDWPDPTFAWNQWIEPIGFLTAIAALASITRTPPRDQRLGLTLLILPSLVFWLFWRARSLGGYYLGIAPFLAVLAAHLAARFPRRSRLPLLVLLLVVQAWRGAAFLQGYSEGNFRPTDQERLDALRQVAEERVLLISCRRPGPRPLQLDLPNMAEINLYEKVHGHHLAGHRPEVFADDVVRHLRILLSDPNRTILLDRRYAEEVLLAAPFHPFLERMEDAIQSSFRVREPLEVPWPLWIVEAK